MKTSIAQFIILCLTAVTLAFGQSGGLVICVEDSGFVHVEIGSEPCETTPCEVDSCDSEVLGSDECSDWSISGIEQDYFVQKALGELSIQLVERLLESPIYCTFSAPLSVDRFKNAFPPKEHTLALSESRPSAPRYLAVQKMLI
ncbi:MAG: hypothetical protein ACPGN3_13680 [Opitutales bacterium]